MPSSKEKALSEIAFLDDNLELGILTQEEYEATKQHIIKKYKIKESDIHETIDEIELEEEKKQAQEEFDIKDEGESQEDSQKSVEPSKPEPTQETASTVNADDERDIFSSVEQVSDQTSTQDTTNPSHAHIPTHPKRNYRMIGLLIALLVVSFLFYGKDLFSQPQTPLQNNPDQNTQQPQQIPTQKVSFTDNSLIIITDSACATCSTNRIQALFHSWFNDLSIQTLDANTINASKLLNDFSLDRTPAYIYVGDLKTSPLYSSIKQSFYTSGNLHALKESAAHATYFSDNPTQQKSIDLFIIESDENSDIANRNGQAFLESAQGDVTFSVHSLNSRRAVNLGITSAPTFLVNNVALLQGVHSPETIKNFYCKYNEVSICDQELSKSLI